MKKIYICGDSFGCPDFGWDIDPWPVILQHQLGNEYEVINLSISCASNFLIRVQVDKAITDHRHSNHRHSNQRVDRPASPPIGRRTATAPLNGAAINDVPPNGAPWLRASESIPPHTNAAISSPERRSPGAPLAMASAWTELGLALHGDRVWIEGNVNSPKPRLVAKRPFGIRRGRNQCDGILSQLHVGGRASRWNQNGVASRQIHG